LHKDKLIDPEAKGKKPLIITFYNATKGGVDTADKMCAAYNVARNIKRWPMGIFFAILNISGINYQVIYHGNDFKPIRRRIFLKSLAHELVIGQICRRSMSAIGIPTSLQKQLKQFYPEAEDNDEYTPGPSEKSRRCANCMSQSSKRRLSRYQSKNCRQSLCL